MWWIYRGQRGHASPPFTCCVKIVLQRRSPNTAVYILCFLVTLAEVYVSVLPLLVEF